MKRGDGVKGSIRPFLLGGINPQGHGKSEAWDVDKSLDEQLYIVESHGVVDCDYTDETQFRRSICLLYMARD